MDGIHSIFRGSNLNLSLRGTFFVTKQSPYSPAGDCFGKKRLAMTGPFTLNF